MSTSSQLHHGHVTSDQPIDCISVRLAPTTVRDIIDGWTRSGVLAHPAMQRPLVFRVAMHLLLIGQPVAGGYLLIRHLPDAKEISAELGLGEAGGRRGLKALREDLEVLRPSRKFDAKAHAWELLPEPGWHVAADLQECFDFANQDIDQSPDTTSDAYPSGASAPLQTGASAPDRRERAAERGSDPPAQARRSGASAPLSTGASAPDRRERAALAAQARRFELLRDRSALGGLGGALVNESKSSSSKGFIDDDDFDKKARARRDEQLLANLALEFPDTATPDELAESLAKRGVGRQRVFARIHRGLLSPELVRDVLVIFSAYADGVQAPGPYIGSMIDDAIAREQAVRRQAERDRAEHRADRFDELWQALDDLADDVLGEAAFRSQAVPRGSCSISEAAAQARDRAVMRRWVARWLVAHPDFLEAPDLDREALHDRLAAVTPSPKGEAGAISARSDH